MAKRFISVGYDLPSHDVEDVELTSKQSLLDADVILFEPNIWAGSDDEYQGKPALSNTASHTWKEAIQHWRQEISDAVAAEKLVIVMLTAPDEVFVATGEVTHSGTGRNRATTRHVTPLSSMDSIPTKFKYREAAGREMVLDAKARVFAPLWSKFSEYAKYEVRIEDCSLAPLLRTKAGGRLVGCYLVKGKGALVLLPKIDFNRDHLTDKKTENGSTVELWNDKAIQLGHEFLATVAALDDAIKAEGTRSPPPDWSLTDNYRLSAEDRLSKEIEGLSTKISELEQERRAAREALDEASYMRALLFEQGKPLEAAIIRALELFGFDAENFDDGENEFDVVFNCPEGRLIGEAEGRDNKEINVTKFSQLERKISEDFERDEVEQHAKGVMFGNPHRLIAPEKRPGLFTTKCLSAAARTNAALVHTADMFAPARYLSDNDDEAFAEKCRNAILVAEGQVVTFPEILP